MVNFNRCLLAFVLFFLSFDAIWMQNFIRGLCFLAAALITVSYFYQDVETYLSLKNVRLRKHFCIAGVCSLGIFYTFIEQTAKVTATRKIALERVHNTKSDSLHLPDKGLVK